jgi:Ser/Thr protein kinase RdoA (MazF antagonist)
MTCHGRTVTAKNPPATPCLTVHIRTGHPGNTARARNPVRSHSSRLAFMVSGPRLETPARLLARWGIPADAELARAERGSNNQTFAVTHGGVRWVLRISQNLSAAQARAEHRLLGRVRAAGLPFGVPEPVVTLSGDTVAETPAGPATLCRWIPGARPDLAAEPALERFGRAVGLLSRALAPVPWSDAPQDWRGDPLRAHPDAPQAAELARALRGAGVPAARVRRLEIAARHVLPWAPETGGDLPVQVVHGDLGASNVLVDERTGEVTGVLDFELAGPGRRIQDLMAALLLSGALAGPGWARRTAALVNGHAALLLLNQAEIMAVPDLLVSRCVGSVFWRAGRWRRGQSALSDVADRVAVLEATETWLAVNRGRLLSVLAAAG